MGFQLFGIIAFVCLFIFDWATLHERGKLKRLSIVVAAIVGGYAQSSALTSGQILHAIPDIPLLAWLAIIFFGSLTVYSLFLEIPFRTTYVNGRANRDGLITSGTYAISRHPGVIWFSFFQLGLVLLTRRDATLYFALLLIILDVLHVVIQDVYFFPKLFPRYALYKQNTPFLLPTWGSLKKGFRTFFSASDRE